MKCKIGRRTFRRCYMYVETRKITLIFVFCFVLLCFVSFVGFVGLLVLLFLKEHAKTPNVVACSAEHRCSTV